MPEINIVSFKVYGTVSRTVANKRKIKLPNLIVRAFDRDLRSEQALGESLTNKEGRYEIIYSPEKFSRSEKNRADIAMKVFTSDGEKLLFESGMDNIIFNAPPEVKYDITIEAEIKQKDNEFDNIIREIAPLLENVQISTLQENNDTRDITFLNKETGIDKSKLEHLVIAHRLGDETKLNPAFFYGLLRENTFLKFDITKALDVRLSIDIDTEITPLLYDAALIDQKIIERDTKTAIKENVIPERVAKELPQILSELGKLKERAQAYKQNEQPQKIIGLIGGFVLSDKISELQNILQKSKNNYSAFFEEISSSSFFKSSDDKQQAKINIAVSEVLGFNEKIISGVKELQKMDKPEDVRKLASLTSSDWKDVLTKSASKIDLAGKTIDKKLVDYHASFLTAKMEKNFPSASFSAHLKREEKGKLKTHNEMVSFFDTNGDFDLLNSNVDLFFKQKKLSGTQNEPLRTELKSIQRVFKLVPNYEKTNALLEKNIHSAQSIVSAGETRFVNEIAPAAGMSTEEAKVVYSKASAANTAAMLIVGDLQDSMLAMDINSLQMKTLSLKLSSVSEDFPNLKSLFKLTDLCECEHCRSVYSPAAYLVELLQYLENRTVVDLTVTPHTSGRLAKDVLFERRPDLGDIDLGCENAETPVPYIDLVCELLEEIISPDPGIEYNGTIAVGVIPNDLLTLLTGAKIDVTDKAVIYEQDVNGDYILRDEKAVCKIKSIAANKWNVKLLHQTHLSAEELAAAPEYINEDVYDNVLSSSSFAFMLPFDLNHTESKAYFSRFDIPRSQLMKDMATAGGPAANLIAAEKLGLSDEERKLIITPDTVNQQLYWNTAPLSAVDEMKVVDHFLTKTGLEYEELQVLLELKFINPAGNLFIKHLDLTCDTEQKEIANLDDAALDRIHRFLRLMKKTGWKSDTLNEMITQSGLGNGTLDDNCLIKMADLLEISEKTGIKLEELTGFYGEIPHVQNLYLDTKPLYHKIFLNKAVNGFIEEGLLPENINGTKQLSDYKTTLALSLQISEQDFDKVVTTFANTDLTFANLSLLYATARLSKKLKLKIDDYILLEDLTGADVFASPADTLLFIENAKKSANSPLKLADVQFMLKHEATNLSDREISDDKIKTLLETLQASYQASFNTNRSPYDDSLKADEMKESLKNLLSKLPGLTEEDVNGFMKMVDRNWISPPDPVASAFIDEKLGSFFNTTDIKNKENDLATAIPLNLEYDFNSEKKALIKPMLKAVSDYLYIIDKESILIKSISTAFKIEDDLTSAVLKSAVLKQPAPGTSRIFDLLSSDSMIDIINDPPAPPAVTSILFPDQYRSVRLLHKLFPLISSLKLQTENAEWMLNHNGLLGWLELDAIPYEGGQTAIAYSKWEELIDALYFINNLTPVPDPADAENPVTLFTVAEMLLPSATTTRDEWLDALALLTGYDRDLLDKLDLHFGFSNPDLSLYKDTATWIQIEKCMGYLRTMGASVEQAEEFIKAKLTSDDTHQLRMALKARYDEALWLDTLKEIMDTIRPQKRDALVAYLLATNPDMEDENDLFDYFLVDVEMEACMPSSRIVQAHGTIQLFVQRCLMGLEPEAAADVNSDSGWAQWEWMKNYRVWEANRKVFLYPENWIEPELRDDKSFLFSELENELMQNEVNEFTTEDAFIRYLEKLDDLAFLEVVAVYYQTDIYTMHVFARTKGGDPPAYYYRQFENERYWTPWEKVDLDITSNQLLAFMHNNRLNLAWPIFSEEANEDQQSTVPAISGSSSSQDVKKTEKKLKIQLAISEFANGKWKPKKISQEGILTPNSYVTYDLPQDPYNFFYNEFTEQIVVFHSELSGGSEYHQLDGIFNITGCKGYPELASTNNNWFPDFFPDFKDSLLSHQRYLEQNADSTNDLAVRNAISFFSFFELLRTTPGNFRLTYPHQFTLIDLIALLYEILIMNALGGKIDLASVSVRKPKLPLGTLLPYFFEDSSHAYVIIPGFYGTDKDPNTGDPVQIYRTYSDTLQLIEDIIALYKKYIKKYQDDPNHDVTALLQELFADPDLHSIIDELKVYQKLKYGEQFKNMYHPLICKLRKTLYKDGVAEMMKRETQLFTNTGFNFNNYYSPNTSVVPPPLPVEDLDFSSDGSYSVYNWELFFHIPMLLATSLSKNQQFEEALIWFHYIFNPTGALEGDVPQKYWVTKPFYLTLEEDYIAQRIDTLLYKLADPSTPERKDLEFAVEEWREEPFSPHTIARFRPVAYQKALLMKYIDNLIEWGDYMFMQDTMESVTQATQLYIMADKLLGPKPRIVPPTVKVPYQTYNQIRAELDTFGNALVDLENILPDFSVLPHEGEELPPTPFTLSCLYFCIPQNDQMLEYWNTIADRLFKIRNCQNIDGVERTLALFAPPIDPGMLVRAAAAGLSISSILSGLNAPLPRYRFNVFSQKATELVQEVRSLGSSLLQALEKKDAEALSLLRSELELKVLKAVRDMKKLQIDDAKEQIEILNKSRKVTEERDKYYSEIQKINPNEQLNLDKLAEAHDFQMSAQTTQAIAGILGLIPDFNLGGDGFGGSPVVHFSWGGSFLAEAANAAASVLNVLSAASSYEANRASILGGYDRRFDDWKLQERLAKKELVQIDAQIEAAKIKLNISETDLKNHDLQIENAKKTDEFMRTKFTNKELYQWMIGQISAVYFKAYKLAFDTAKKAERCYQLELGNTDTFIGYGYWDSLKKGLQSADSMFHDIKRMEVSYFDKNKREYELTKHISLAMLDPLALERLKATGTCDLEIPEALFDMDNPGHYFRRIKTVSITLPCIAGPYTSVSCKLSLVNNRYRKNTASGGGYEEDPGNDERFTYNVGTIQSIATSTSQNDSGLFELSFRDERYLPFEGCGAISTWRLELPNEIRQFDYNTISDIIIHLKYTAREGGSSLRTLAVSSLTERLNLIKQQLNDTGLHIAFNIKRDMPNEWFMFKQNGTVNLQITKSRLPYFAQLPSLTTEIDKITFIANVKNNPGSFTITIDGVNLLLNRKDEWKLCLGNNTSIELDTPFDLAVAQVQLGNLDDLVMVVKYVFS